MRRALRGSLLLAASQVSRAALLRATAAAASADAASDVETVERLLLDVDQSIKKAGSDAEFVYTSLYNYDSQLEAGLDAEIAKAQQEISGLSNASHSLEANTSSALTSRGSLRSQMDQVFETIRVLTDFMAHGSMAKVQLNVDEQRLGPTIVLTGSLKSLRHLLLAHQDLRPHFVDVFEAFLPVRPLALVQAKATNLKRAPMKVHLTPPLRQHTAAALAAIKDRLSKDSDTNEAQALVQTRTSSTMKEARQGMVAESEQQTQELKFSATFAEAVVKIDREFKAKVHESIMKKADIVEAIRRSRDAQHRTLGALVDLLRGKYLAAAAAGGDDQQPQQQEGSADYPPSFMQVDSEGPKPSAAQPSALQLQIEAALHDKVDTHDILMKIKGMLVRSVPSFEAEGVSSVVDDLQNVLDQVQHEQSRADELKAHCQEQLAFSGKEEHQLEANFDLMSAVQSRTKAAISKANLNLKSVVAKVNILTNNAKDLASVVAQSTSTLEDQSRDRHTIMVAVEKAREIVVDRTSAGPAAEPLLQQLLQELKVQDNREREYRSAEVGLKASYAAYTQQYLQMLDERRGHYETALSSLELYAGEVESDVVTQADAISMNKALTTEGSDACDGLLQAYVADSERRRALGGALQSVMPDLPKMLA